MIKVSSVLLVVVLGIFLIGAVPVLAAGEVNKAPGAAGTYNWTGFYAGFNAGYGFGGKNSADQAPVTSNTVPAFTAGAIAQPNALSPSGFIGGGQFGYNYQFNRLWLGGLEADIQYTDFRDSDTQAITVPPFGFAPEQTSVDQQLKWIGTVRARVGVLPIDRLLLYVTGGLAYGRVDRTATISFPSIGQEYSGSASSTKTGWTIGGGVEWAFWKTVSLKAEYLYYDLGSEDVDVTPVAGGVPAVTSASFQTKGQIVRAGLNYRF